jgi:hypothetical protein
MRKKPEYHPPFPLDIFVEEECMKKARENMLLRKFQDADRFLHRAILCGSTKAVDFLIEMRTKMQHANYSY